MIETKIRNTPYTMFQNEYQNKENNQLVKFNEENKETSYMRFKKGGVSQTQMKQMTRLDLINELLCLRQFGSLEINNGYKYKQYSSLVEKIKSKNTYYFSLFFDIDLYIEDDSNVYYDEINECNRKIYCFREYQPFEHKQCYKMNKIALKKMMNNIIQFLKQYGCKEQNIMFSGYRNIVYKSKFSLHVIVNDIVFKEEYQQQKIFNNKVLCYFADMLYKYVFQQDELNIHQSIVDKQVYFNRQLKQIYSYKQDKNTMHIPFNILGINDNFEDNILNPLQNLDIYRDYTKQEIEMHDKYIITQNAIKKEDLFQYYGYPEIITYLDKQYRDGIQQRKAFISDQYQYQKFLQDLDKLPDKYVTKTQYWEQIIRMFAYVFQSQFPTDQDLNSQQMQVYDNYLEQITEDAFQFSIKEKRYDKDSNRSKIKQMITNKNTYKISPLYLDVILQKEDIQQSQLYMNTLQKGCFYQAIQQDMNKVGYNNIIFKTRYLNNILTQKDLQNVKNEIDLSLDTSQKEEGYRCEKKQIYFFSSSCNTGKSVFEKDLLYQMFEQNNRQTITVLLCVSKRTLARDQYSNLMKLDSDIFEVRNYLDIVEEDNKPMKIQQKKSFQEQLLNPGKIYIFICGILSIHQLNQSIDFDVFLCDETVDFVQQIAGEFEQEQQLIQIYQLKNIIKKVQHMWFLDGLMSSNDVSIIQQRLLQKYIRQSKTKIFINTYNPFENVQNTVYLDFRKFEYRLEQYLISNQKVSVCSDNINSLKACEIVAKRHNVNYFFMIASDRIKDQNEKQKHIQNMNVFIENPDKFLEDNKIQMLIYSPVLVIGVNIFSIEICMCIYTQTIFQQNSIQQVLRNRSLKELHYYLKEQLNHKQISFKYNNNHVQSTYEQKQPMNNILLYFSMFETKFDVECDENNKDIIIKHDYGYLYKGNINISHDKQILMDLIETLRFSLEGVDYPDQMQEEKTSYIIPENLQKRVLDLQQRIYEIQKKDHTQLWILFDIKKQDYKIYLRQFKPFLLILGHMHQFSPKYSQNINPFHSAIKCFQSKDNQEDQLVPIENIIIFFMKYLTCRESYEYINLQIEMTQFFANLQMKIYLKKNSSIINKNEYLMIQNGISDEYFNKNSIVTEDKITEILMHIMNRKDLNKNDQQQFLIQKQTHNLSISHFKQIADMYYTKLLKMLFTKQQYHPISIINDILFDNNLEVNILIEFFQIKRQNEILGKFVSYFNNKHKHLIIEEKPLKITYIDQIYKSKIIQQKNNKYDKLLQERYKCIQIQYDESYEHLIQQMKLQNINDELM